MLLSTPGLVLHTTPYAESSVVAKVFTRQLGVRSYIIKGVRGRSGRVKQNLLQPLSSLDMVVYDNHRKDLNYIKELVPRHPQQSSEPVYNALRFFMTEVLYKALREEEPMQDLWDYVENGDWGVTSGEWRVAEVPIVFLLKVAHYMGIKPLDNYSLQSRYFCLEEGRYVSAPNETTLPESLSETLHCYLEGTSEQPSRNQGVTSVTSRRERTDMVNALIAYFQMHLSGFRNFKSHEILHGVLSD